MVEIFAMGDQCYAVIFVLILKVIEITVECVERNVKTLMQYVLEGNASVVLPS